MQNDVLNDQLPNENDYSSSLSTSAIYSGLELHSKPFLSSIVMSNMASSVSIVKKLPVPDTHSENLNKSLTSSIRHSPTSATSSSSIRLVTPTTGQSSSSTALQFQILDKSSSSSTTTTTNGGSSASKTYIINPQQTNPTGTSSSSSIVTLLPPVTTSAKIQTLISSTNDLSNNNGRNSPKQSSLLSKTRVTFVQSLIPSSSSSSNSLTPKLVIQQNTTSNMWSQQPTAKILSAKMLSRPVHLISSNEHSNLSSPTSNENPIFTTKNFDSGHQTFIHMPLLPSTTNTEPINSLQITNFCSTSPSFRISTSQRSMDHNNNHSGTTTSLLHQMQTDDKFNDSTMITNTCHNKNCERLPLQPSTQQTSLAVPITTKKHKLTEDEQISLWEPPTKVTHYQQFHSTSTIRQSRHRSASKLSIENTTPNLLASDNVDKTENLTLKKRSSAEVAAAAIFSSAHLRKKRMQRKFSAETNSNNKHESVSFNDSSVELISDELLRRLSQDFSYLDKRTGIRWITTKSRSQPINKLLSRFSWKTKINHYKKYSDISRMQPKRTVPVQSFDLLHKRLSQPYGSWRIDRLTTHITDLTEDERTSQKNLSDIGQLLDQFHIDDYSVRDTIGELIEGNIQRHRSFCEQLSQISTLLVNLLDHKDTLQEICSTSTMTTNPNSMTNLSSTPTTRRIKER